MKCNGRKILRTQKVDACHGSYAVIMYEFIDVEFAKIMIHRHGWKTKRLKWLFDTERQFVDQCFRRYAAESGRIKDPHRGYRDLTSDEIIYKNMLMAQETIDDDLNKLGFTYDPLELVPEIIRVGGWEKERIKATHRMIWYNKTGQPLARLYVTALLKLMHDEKEFGAVRLTPLYGALAERVRWYVENFLTGTERCEKAIKSCMDEGHAEMQRLGIELLEISDESDVPPKKTLPKGKPPITLDGLAWRPEDIKTSNTERRILNHGKSEF